MAGEHSAIVLRSGTLAGPSDDAGLPAHLVLPDAAIQADGGAVLVRFDSPVTPDVRSELEEAGGRWISSVAADAAILVLAPGALEAVRSRPGVAWAGPYHPGLRIAPEVFSVAEDDPRPVVPLTLRVFSDADAGEVADRLESLGLPVRGVSSGRGAEGRLGEWPGRIVLTPTPSQIVATRETIALWPETLWIGRRPVYRLLNDDSVWILQSGLRGRQATPAFDHGLSGDGQVIGMLDTGLDADMCFFRDPVLGLPPTVEGLGVGSPDPSQRKVLIVDFLWSSEDPSHHRHWDTQGHGTHVAGSVAGDDLATPGSRDPGDGMAPASKLVIQDAGYEPDDCADFPALGCPTTDLTPFFEQAYLQGARIHSNSYGDRENLTPHNIYSDGSEEADATAWSYPDLLLLFAAGNDGSASGTVGSPATAKNVLAVGATRGGSEADELTAFSSRGPTHDGRIKPDVTAPGAGANPDTDPGVISADNDRNILTDNCDTTSMSGTSMATPMVAGLAALAREYFEKGYYPTGDPVPGDALTPSSALLRAALIASAAPMEKASAPPPSDDQGWGRVTLDDVLYFAGDSRRLLVADVADRFDSPSNTPDVHPVEVLESSEPLRVVVSWTDYPSTPVAATNLVNDLDVELMSPSGTVYLGNVLSGGVSQTGGSQDRFNNVEVFRIEDPEPGTWTVTVTPFAVPEPSQGYAMVATGAVPTGGVFLERTALLIDDTVGGDGDGDLEAGEWVDLQVTLQNTGDTAATGVNVSVESLTASVEVVVADAVLNDIATGAVETTLEPHLRIHLATDTPCPDTVSLRFTYRADGFETTEDREFGTGTEQVIHLEDFEGATEWTHAGEQDPEGFETTGDWTAGDPEGTWWNGLPYQPEDDVTTGAGNGCFFTASNPDGEVGVEDVDFGWVLARSGYHDLSGHPEARVSVWRWFGIRYLNDDPGDWFRLQIREGDLAPDVVMENLDNTASRAVWERVTFRVADYITPGATVQVSAVASDGPVKGNLVEAAIDEVLFWEPVCDTWDPAPNRVEDLRLVRTGDDVVLTWSRPGLDPQHGETSDYRIYRSESASGGFTLSHETSDTAAEVSWTDAGAAGAGSPSFLAWEVIASNAAGDSDLLP